MKTLLGQRIREQRRKKGWTMDKLAEKADLSVNYVLVIKMRRCDILDAGNSHQQFWMLLNLKKLAR